MKQTIIDTIKAHKLIAIVRGMERENCMQIAQALYDGGIRLMELTYNQSCPESWEQTAQTVGALAQAFQGKLYVGAGTVTCPELVELTHRHGGQFVISPDVNEAVIRRTVQLGLVSIPGAMTPTEIMTAHRAGAHFVKLFPSSHLGVDYLRTVKAPISHVDILAVGGITEKNVGAFLAAGACGAAVGGNLVQSSWVQAGEFKKITQAARTLVAAIE